MSYDPDRFLRYWWRNARIGAVILAALIAGRFVWAYIGG